MMQIPETLFNFLLGYCQGGIKGRAEMVISLENEEGVTARFFLDDKKALEIYDPELLNDRRILQFAEKFGWKVVDKTNR